MFLFTLLAACGTSEPPQAPEAAHQEKAHEHGDEDAHAKKEAEEHAGMEMGPNKTASNADWTHYGEAFALDASTDCKEIIADPDASVGKTVRVNGKIENVCQKAGCWMVVADDDGKYLRITMKEHAFGVPTDTKTGDGTRVDVEGELVKKELDAKTLEHLKGEAKGTPEELEKQFAPSYEIIASGVAVKNG